MAMLHFFVCKPQFRVATCFVIVLSIGRKNASAGTTLLMMLQDMLMGGCELLMEPNRFPLNRAA